jgi:sphingomyelin phosphodiesterase acid-like 3
MVGSITPVDGNTPSFTVAQVDPATAALVDYRVFEASNKTGIDATWKEEYDFAHTYHAPAFDAVTVGKLTAGFEADASAKAEASQAYMRDFFVGDMSPILGLFWPQYACTLSNRSAAAYKACLCSDAK